MDGNEHSSPTFSKPWPSAILLRCLQLSNDLRHEPGSLDWLFTTLTGSRWLSRDLAAAMHSLTLTAIQKSLRKGADERRFRPSGDAQWLEEVLPLHDGNRLEGRAGAGSRCRLHPHQGNDLWQRSFWRIVALVLLIAAVTFVMVRWFLLRPMTRMTERLRRLRIGHVDETAENGAKELSIFTPLAREVETMAESLMAARAAAEAEARLREAGEHLWTAERLAVHMRERSGSSRIFVVSNREPYMHVRQGREVVCMVPPSGLVTAIEPVLRACDGVWVASGSGDADAETVDEFDRLRVPPDDPRYTLRRVWLSNEEEAQLLRRLCQRRTLAALPYRAHAPHLPRRRLGVLSARERALCSRAAGGDGRTASIPSSLCRTTILRCCRGW